MDFIKAEAPIGASFDKFSLTLKNSCVESACFEFDFNGVTCRVSKDTDIELLQRGPLTGGWRNGRRIMVSEKDTAYLILALNVA